jgi:chromosome segregation ATPase
MKLSQTKLFTFNAGSFALDSSVEGFLKSKEAISLDFGATAYINCEAMPAILSELVEKSKADASSNARLVDQLKAELGRFNAEKQKMVEDNARLESQLRSNSLELAALKEQTAGNAKTIEALRADNAHLQAALKNATPKATVPVAPDDKLKQSYENLQKEFQKLRSQSIDAITSLKVLEDENDELREELEQLKSRSKNAATAKTS